MPRVKHGWIEKEIALQIERARKRSPPASGAGRLTWPDQRPFWTSSVPALLADARTAQHRRPRYALVRPQASAIRPDRRPRSARAVPVRRDRRGKRHVGQDERNTQTPWHIQRHRDAGCDERSRIRLDARRRRGRRTWCAMSAKGLRCPHYPRSGHWGWPSARLLWAIGGSAVIWKRRDARSHFP
jgi:hypothetical protein